MKKLLSLILLISAPAMGWSQSASALFQEANQAYQKEQFRESIHLYDSILELGQESAALYYNLGNAHYKTGNLAKAILNYERALQLRPADEETLQNLKIARQKTIDRFEELPKPLFRTVYLAVLLWLSPDNWAVVALVFLGILLLGAALYLFSPYKRIGFISALAGLILGGLSLSLAYAHREYQESNREAIIMSASTYVKSGPAESAEDTFILHEGTKAVVTESFEGWRKIRLPDGKLGWVPAEDIEVI